MPVAFVVLGRIPTAVFDIMYAACAHGYIVSAYGRWKVVGPTSLNCASFRGQIRCVRLERLVFLDESWLSVAMSRSHAWVQHRIRKTRGYPYILE